MKKTLSALIVTLLASSAVFAAQQAPAKYELGEYNFDFVTPSAPVQVEDAPAVTMPTQELPQLKQPTIPATTQKVNVQPTQQLKPISTKMYSQKEIIEQVKQEEKASQAAEKIKQDNAVVTDEINKLRRSTAEDMAKIEQKGKEVTEAAEQKRDTTKVKTEQRLNKPKQELTKPEKPIKFDKDKPPVMFKIVPIQYDGTSTKTIERL